MEVTTKPFFSVFPDLKVSDDVRSLFEDANIREITLKKKENTLKISFQCDHLISRVRYMENGTHDPGTAVFKAFCKDSFSGKLSPVRTI